MISQYDFYYELTVDIVATCLFALLFIIILFLNYQTKFSDDSQSYSDVVNNAEQDKTDNETTQTSTTTSSSS
jgi:hypothetical protein